MSFSKNKEKKEVRLKTIIFSFVIIFGVIFLIFTLAIYALPFGAKARETVFVKKITRHIPFPVAVLDGFNFISLKRVVRNLESAKNFYENQDFSNLSLRVDFSTEDGKKRLKIKEKEILNKLIEDEIIKIESKKRKIIVSDEMVDQAVERKMKEYGTGENLKENLEKLYGWTVDDFKKNIVKPDLYKEKLMEDVQKNNADFEKAQAEIEKAEKELKGGASFSEIAKKYSQGESAGLGGELGWFNLSQMIPEAAVSIITLEKGETSGIIQSSIGFHIIKLEDKKNEDGKEFFKISQIFTRVKPFSEWLMEIQKEYQIYVPLQEFYWDKENLRVMFSDEKMQAYEKKAKENPGNDPSLW